MDPLVVKFIAAAACMAVGSIAPVLAEGWIAGKTMEAVGRNPAIGDKAFSNMIVAMAICESMGIFCLVISLILLFVA